MTEGSQLPQTVVIVDDEADIRQLVKTFFMRYHFEVKEAGTGHELMELLKNTQPDLIILDLMLPDIYGLDLCKEIRKTNQVPIIVLTAVGGDVNTVLGFEAGADDYLEKPFSTHVLLSRIQAVLRRCNQNPEDVQVESKDPTYTKAFFSHWTYFPDESCLKSNVGKTIFLTRAEGQLLNLFLHHEEIVLSREKIAQALKLDASDPESRAIDVQISRLRAKLKDKSQNNLIRSVRNKGYLLTVPVRFA